MTNGIPLTRNYDSHKEKSEINSNIRILKIKQRLAVHSVSVDSLLLLLTKNKIPREQNYENASTLTPSLPWAT